MKSLRSVNRVSNRLKKHEPASGRHQQIACIHIMCTAHRFVHGFLSEMYFTGFQIPAMFRILLYVHTLVFVLGQHPFCLD